MEIIKAAKLDPRAILPTRKHSGDAGIDFYSNEAKTIPPHSFDVVKTGITIEIDNGYVGLLMPKSRNNHLLGAGVVDAGYQGEIMVKLANITDVPLEITPGMAIAQMLIMPIVLPQIKEIPIEEIHKVKTDRGATGGILGTE